MSRSDCGSVRTSTDVSPKSDDASTRYDESFRGTTTVTSPWVDAACTRSGARRRSRWIEPCWAFARTSVLRSRVASTSPWSDESRAAPVKPDTFTSPLPDHSTTATPLGTRKVYDAVHQYATGTEQLASRRRRWPRTCAVWSVPPRPLLTYALKETLSRSLATTRTEPRSV